MSNETKKDFSEYTIDDWNEFCEFHYHDFWHTYFASVADDFYVQVVQNIPGFSCLEITKKKTDTYYVCLTMDEECECCGHLSKVEYDFYDKELAIALIVAGLQAVGILDREGKLVEK